MLALGQAYYVDCNMFSKMYDGYCYWLIIICMMDLQCGYKWQWYSMWNICQRKKYLIGKCKSVVFFYAVSTEN